MKKTQMIKTQRPWVLLVKALIKCTQMNLIMDNPNLQSEMLRILILYTLIMEILMMGISIMKRTSLMMKVLWMM